jgi:hypothetical protein
MPMHRRVAHACDSLHWEIVMHPSASFGRVRLEQLENRVLFSVTFSPTIAADRAAIAADLVQLQNDRLAGAQTVGEDRKAVAQQRHLRTAPDPSLVAKLTNDRAALKDLLTQDRQLFANTITVDAAAIRADMAQIRADRLNSTALAADLTKLDADRSNRESDRIAGAASVRQDQLNGEATLAQDRDAVRASRGSGAGALDAALAKLSVDRSTVNQTIQADRDKLKADRATFRDDVRNGA